MAEPNFNQPIPGHSLTTDIASSPIKNPPQYATIDEAVDFYIQRMSTDEFVDNLATSLEAGVTVSQIANIIQMHGVMEGQHTLDISILILPILMEFIRYLAEIRGIEYKLGIDEYDTDRADDPLIVNAVNRLKRENRSKGMPEIDMEEQEVNEQDQEQEQLPDEDQSIRGLMARGI
tara:strand:- start:207 stop:734 length:528 start_codon:yes stop_codon:yes gene_type:complete